MKDPIVIGLHGRAGSGKDTVAEILRGQLILEGYYPVVLRFSQPLKQVAKLVFGLSDAEVETEEGKASSPPQCYGFTIRQIQQLIGSDMFRDLIHQDIWVDRLKQRIFQTIRGEYDKADVFVNHHFVNSFTQFVFIVPDVRFENEIAAVREFKNVIVEVDRPGNVSSATGTNHISEKDLRHLVDFVIPNTGTIEDLRPLALEILDRFDLLV